MDLTEKTRSESEERNASSQVKSCSDCKTSRTPLWRGGPEGPKSLCNACGIKYNKKRRQVLGLDRSRNEKVKKKRSKGGDGGVGGGNEMPMSLTMRWMALKGEPAIRRSEKLLSQLREEEQAAILLMALSYGSVYA